MDRRRFTAVGESDSLVRHISGRAEVELTGRVPDFSTGACVATDFGGEHKEADFHTYGFLVCPGGSLAGWDAARREVRRPELGTSVMGYKHLKDGRRERALGRFLEIADDIPGFLAVVGVSKNVGLVGSEDIKTHESVSAWKSNSREKLARILPMVVAFAGGVLVDDVDITWVTDRDEITEGGRLQATADALKAGLRGTCLGWRGELRAVSTAADDDDLLYEDFTAIPDLAAGAVCDVLNADSIALPDDVAPKTRAIIRWMGCRNVPLTRLGYTLRRVEDGRLELAQLAWGDLEQAASR